jgi:Flp pilus assembly pilin Flp
MLRKFVSSLLHDQRGNNLIAYALLLGGIAVAGATYLSQVSTDLKAGLNNQADKIAVTAGTYKAPAATPNSPVSVTPTPVTPTGGSGTSGKGNGKKK